MMELIELTLPDGDQTQFQIAFVNEPATESNFQAFKKVTPYKFQEVDKAKRLVMGYFMIADKKIDRYDPEKGAYQVLFKSEAIDKIVDNWAINGLNKNLNENHNTNDFANGVFVREHFQLGNGKKAPDGFDQEPDGSWFGVVKCLNDEIYQKCIDGTYNGFSVENVFQENKFAKLDELLESLKVTK